MSIEFAEHIIDSMVDENGQCGERGISSKQYDVLRPYLEESEAEPCGAWYGDRGGGVTFYKWTAEGYVGRYYVKINCMEHFNFRAVVESIRRWIDEVPSFEGSEWVGEPKERMELDLTVIRRYDYERPAFTYGYETVSIYTMADDSGNCFVWKTTSSLGMDTVYKTLEDGTEFCSWVPADIGSKVRMKATVKEHGEYKGIKQTVITRPKVLEMR